METIFWGPSGWLFIHTLTFIYPENPNFTEKVKMREFINLLAMVLPCKYCRASFTKYTNNLQVNEYLDSRDKLVEWLYKIHNKVNAKLRRQGFCTTDNPCIENVKKHYSVIVNNIKNILIDKMDENNNDKLIVVEKVQNAVNYICNLGRDFLGSIIFNYQGYFTNCHTSDEKVKIITVYNAFFNSLLPVIIACLNKLCNKSIELDVKDCIREYKIKKFNIRRILQQNEPYSKLIKWFYECDELCKIKEQYKTQNEYETHFQKHIVSSCNNPTSDNIKSCRKITKKQIYTKSHLSKKHLSKKHLFKSHFTK
jgi:hypothetical protein